MNFGLRPMNLVPSSNKVKEFAAVSRVAAGMVPVIDVQKRAHAP